MDEVLWMVAHLRGGPVCLPAHEVVEVFPLGAVTRIPWTPSWVLGGVYRAGELVTVVDLSGFLATDVTGGVRPRTAIRVVSGVQHLALGVGGVTTCVEPPADAVRLSAGALLAEIRAMLSGGGS